MDSLESAKQLMRAGYFGDALKALEEGHIRPAQRITSQVTKAELLERIGRHGQSRPLVTSLRKSKGLTNAQLAACEHILAKLFLEDGETEEAFTHLQRAIPMAIEADDLERLCWVQLNLLLVVADRSGPEVSTP